MIDGVNHKDEQGIRVLLVEENPDDEERVRSALGSDRNRPIRLDMVPSVPEAIHMLQENSFDLVLLDLGIPQDRCEPSLLQLHATVPHIPVIVLTNTDDPSLSERCIKAGASDYLVKGRSESFIARAIYSAATRAAMRKAVDASYENIRRILADSHDAILVLAQDRTVQFANDAAHALFGDEVAEGQRFTRPIPGQGYPLESEVVRPDQEKVVVEVRVSETVWYQAPARLVSFRDVTERKRMEEERQKLEQRLQQSRKMEAIGTLAGGVAHDFNNLLTTILGHADLALSELRPHDPLYEDLMEIKRAGEKAAGLTRQLLSFSRKETRSPQLLDLNTVLRDMHKMLRRLVPEDIELVVDLQENLWPLYMDPSQMDQVIINLVVNARDAMPDGGTLTIETTNVELDRAYFKDRGLEEEPGKFVLLAVTDTGVGMTEAVRSRMFEPFFTTKSRGTGTGLGLATVFGIVKQNRGYVWAYSEPGHGTTMKVYLPRTSRDTGEGGGSDLVLVRPTGSETVLVVEDNDAVRKLTTAALRRFGYRVLDAPNGEEALDVARAFRGHIHLLLTDVIMPGMSGKALSARLGAWHPGLRTLYMSGYTENVIMRKGVVPRDIHYIQKPFSPAALARKVGEVLELGIQSARREQAPTG